MARVEEIEVLVCDECGYWRQPRGREDGAVHQTANPDNPRGAMVTHPLQRRRFVRCLTAGEEQEGAS